METQYNKIIKKMDLIDPVKYSRDRNFIDGSISKLSPYISRGVISTKIVFNYLINKGFEFTKIEKFIQELCWRDYWQLIWCEKKHLINNDLKNKHGNHDNTMYNSWWSETHHGVMEEIGEDGNLNYNYQIDVNQSLASKLKGNLMLSTCSCSNK